MLLNYIKLGGTLFIPAIHKSLESTLHGKKYKNLKSVAVDIEDSIAENDVKEALKCIKNMLKNFKKTELFVFIRPRNIEVLKEILQYANIEKMDGFILPKFSLVNAQGYLELLRDTKFFIMPSIEGTELFESAKLLNLRDILLCHSEKIILIRFGLEDMLRQLRMRRKCEDSIFDFSVTSSIIGNFLAIFKSAGFEVSGGVYPCFEDKEGFKRDVIKDLKEGLFSKTIIHPSQIEIINDVYKVSKKEYEDARKITTLKAAIGVNDAKMLESSTMIPYAQYILQRADEYGIQK
ncbi:MAG: citrate lyase beta subunit [Sulfurimonas sp.]|jgi:citrate lyase beta subunit|uniref:HpcH/HpaI aldolase/citrate lyase family protein n=1 Tax=Sulfurimonas sp. TaxID=2022749 RepID=UPI0039E3A654